MRTQTLSKALSDLAKALKALPDMEVSDLSKLVSASASLSNASIAMGLTTLVALSDIDKNQWIAFITENNLPIEIRPRDASRDILGKILNYLQANREARNMLAHSARSERSTTSPELQRALQLLLRT